MIELYLACRVATHVTEDTTILFDELITLDNTLLTNAVLQQTLSELKSKMTLKAYTLLLEREYFLFKARDRLHYNIKSEVVANELRYRQLHRGGDYAARNWFTGTLFFCTGLLDIFISVETLTHSY